MMDSGWTPPIERNTLPNDGRGGMGTSNTPWQPSPHPMATAKTKSDGSSTEYYKIPPNATDIIDLIEYKNMNFSIGNIFKACYRIGQKEGNDDSYDLRKMIFFAQRELARIGKT